MSFSVACFLGLLTCDASLSQAPARMAVAAPAPAVSDSVITLVLSLPYATLGKAVEAKLPQSISLEGNGQEPCANILFAEPGSVSSHQECRLGICINVPDFTGPSIGTRRQCAGHQWKANVAKDGALSLSKASTAMRVAQGIRVTGKAGLQGTLADIFSLSGKNFDVRVAATMDVGARLDKDWCPQVSVTPVGRWVTEARAELVGRNCIGFDLGPLGRPQACAGPVNVDLAGKLNEEFDKHKDEVQRAASRLLPCEQVRSKLSPHWQPYAIKIERGTQAPLFLNISPKSAGFSGVIAEADRLKAVVRVGAQTYLSVTPAGAGTLALPVLGDAGADRGGLVVNLRAVAPYALLKGELVAALKGKVYGGGDDAAKIKILDVDVYPSDSSVAVGLRVEVKTRNKWFDTVGWVFVTGQPVPVDGGRAVRFEKVAFSSVLDHKLWSAAQAVFEDQILSALRARATFDLSKEIAKASSEVSTAIAKAEIRGIRLTVGTASVALAGIHLENEGLAVYSILKVPFDAEVTDFAIQ